jgi:hypothetical protein
MNLQPTIDRHPEVAASSAALEGRRPGSVILRGAQERAPSATTAKPLRRDDENNHRRHCEERSDEAIHLTPGTLPDGLLRCARNDGKHD